MTVLWRLLHISFGLQTPNGANISQCALIRVNRPAKSPVATVTLFGQHGQQDFDLRDFSQLYKLFEAVINSEFALMQKRMQCLSDTLCLMRMPSTYHQGQSSLSFATMWMCLYAVLPMVEQNCRWLCAQKCRAPLRTLVRTIKDRSGSSRKPSNGSRKCTTPLKTSFQPSKPSNLRYELIQREEIPFHFITWPRIQSVTSPKDLTESLDLGDFITVDGEPDSDYEEFLLFVSMNWAALRLIDEHVAPLAKELSRLRVLLSRSRRGADPPFGPTSGQLTHEWVGEDDKIHIVCRRNASDKIRIWMIDAGQGRKSWVIQIEKCTESTRPPLLVLRKKCTPLVSKYVLIAPKKARLT